MGLFPGTQQGQGHRAKKRNADVIYPWRHAEGSPEVPGQSDHLAVAQLFSYRVNAVLVSSVHPGVMEIFTDPDKDLQGKSKLMREDWKEKGRRVIKKGM